MAELTYRIIGGKREYIVRIENYTGYFGTLTEALKAISKLFDQGNP